MSEELHAIGDLIEEWGFTVYRGVNGAEMLRVTFDLAARRPAGDRYVKVIDGMLIVLTGGVQETVLSVFLGAPDSLDKLKEALSKRPRWAWLNNGKT